MPEEKNAATITVLDIKTMVVVHNMWLKVMGFPPDPVGQSPASIAGYLQEWLKKQPR